PDWQKGKGDRTNQQIADAALAFIQPALKRVFERELREKQVPAIQEALYRRNFDTPFPEDLEEMAPWEFWNKVLVRIEVPHRISVFREEVEELLRQLLWKDAHVTIVPEDPPSPRAKVRGRRRR